MVATDGHRLSFVEKPNETLEGISGEKRVLIPRKALQELQQLLANTEAEKVEFADDEHTLFFRVGHRTLSTAASSPASSPTSRPSCRATTPSSPWSAPASSPQPSSASPSSPTSAPAPSACALKATSSRSAPTPPNPARAKTPSTRPTPSDPIAVGFNSVYILDFLKALDNEGEVRLEFKDSQSAGQMRPEDPDAEYKYRYVLMPMRI